jgi:hypothetical protein
LNYAEDKYFKLPENPEYEPLPLPQSNNTIVITEPAHDFAFRAGILNSNINGRYVVVVEDRHLNKIIEAHHGNVDLIVTEQLRDVDHSVNVFVPKGSGILAEHPKRTEL